MLEQDEIVAGTNKISPLAGRIPVPGVPKNEPCHFLSEKAVEFPVFLGRVGELE